MKFAASALTLALFGVLPVSATSLALSPANLTVSHSEFSLNVDVSDVVDLYAFQFNIQFQPDLLSATSVSEGGFLSAAGSTIFVPGTIDNAAGFVTFTGDTLVGLISGMDGTGTLATINFNALSPGTSSVSLYSPTFLDSQLFSIPLDTVSGASVTVEPAAVPEPANGVLIGLALCILLVLHSLAAKKDRTQQ